MEGRGPRTGKGPEGAEGGMHGPVTFTDKSPDFFKAIFLAVYSFQKSVEFEFTQTWSKSSTVTSCVFWGTLFNGSQALLAHL